VASRAWWNASLWQAFDSQFSLFAMAQPLQYLLSNLGGQQSEIPNLAAATYLNALNPVRSIQYVKHDLFANCVVNYQFQAVDILDH
jgi:hypothetical protein